MNLLADESVDGSIVERLRADGHQVEYVAESRPGIPDAEVLALARETKAILLTADKDFGELVFRQEYSHFGVLLIRLPGLDSGDKTVIVSTTLGAHGTQLPGRFSVLTPETLRIRH